MERMKRAGYRGRKPGGGLTPEQAAVAILTVMAAVLLMTMKVNSQWCGKTCGQQLYEAVFVTEDWS